MKKIRRGRFRINRSKAQRPSYLRLVKTEPAPELLILRPSWTIGAVEYRSRLDFGWARCLHAAEEPADYRSRSVDLGDRRISLPFFLPRVRQAIVTRPTLRPVEREWEILRRVRAALAAEHPFPGDTETGPVVALVIAASVGRFQGLDGEALAFVRCRRCFASWFLDTAGWWGCRACGAYDGDRHLSEWLHSPLPNWSDVLRAGEVA